jgi:hypothetical protein
LAKAYLQAKAGRKETTQTRYVYLTGPDVQYA